MPIALLFLDKDKVYQSSLLFDMLCHIYQALPPLVCVDFKGHSVNCSCRRIEPGNKAHFYCRSAVDYLLFLELNVITYLDRAT